MKWVKKHKLAAWMVASLFTIIVVGFIFPSGAFSLGYRLGQIWGVALVVIGIRHLVRNKKTCEKT